MLTGQLLWSGKYWGYWRYLPHPEVSSSKRVPAVKVVRADSQEFDLCRQRQDLARHPVLSSLLYREAHIPLVHVDAVCMLYHGPAPSGFKLSSQLGHRGRRILAYDDLPARRISSVLNRLTAMTELYDQLCLTQWKVHCGDTHHECSICLLTL